MQKPSKLPYCVLLMFIKERIPMDECITSKPARGNKCKDPCEKSETILGFPE